MPRTLSQTFDTLAQQKSNFLATISHELRTPMQSIYGLLELMQGEATTPVLQEMVRAARSSAGLMLDLLDDILDFAKLDAGRMELEELEIPIRTLVQGVIEALEVRVRGRPVTLKANIEDNVPGVVLGDPKRLRQILFNLVSNALKFTETGTITIAVQRTEENEQKKVTLRFAVMDTGAGIPQDIQSRLFKPFTQADSSTARKFGGTGLGLSICHKLVDLMQGKIGVESQIGQGSTFWFTLPTQEVEEKDLAPSDLDLSGLLILVADSHPQGAADIERSLRQMGAKVLAAKTAHETRATLEESAIDVAIVDYELPDGSGLDLLHKIIERQPRAGLIMYTVHDHEGLQQTLQTLGVTYLGRPASRLGLGQTILDVTRRQWHYAENRPQKVLLAEDTESVQEVFKRQLAALGVESSLVANGRQALEQLKKEPYGLVITDLHMPEMDGYALIRRIRATEDKEARQPVVLLTADVQMAQRAIYLQHGFDDCLIKPVTLNHLRQMLQRWGIRTRQEGTREPAFSDEPSTGQKADTALIDLPQLTENIGGTRKDAIDMIKIFPSMCAPLVEDLRALTRTEDFEKIRDLAHSLKGAARSGCCTQLGDLAADLQERAENRLPPGDLIDRVTAAFAALVNYIRTL